MMARVKVDERILQRFRCAVAHRMAKRAPITLKAALEEAMEAWIQEQEELWGPAPQMPGLRLPRGGAR